MARSYDVAVVGGGIVGTATAMALARTTRAAVVILEAEDRLASHQSGRNSGVIHSGLYYRPGSLKARYCVEGREAMYRFCAERGIAHERCGKVVIATHDAELPALAELERRGAANGLEGIRRLDPTAIRAHEPAAVGIAGLLVPQTGIVDYPAVTRAFADDVVAAGGEVLTRARVAGVRREGGGLVVETARGPIQCRRLVNCAGLQSDRIARLCGVEPGVRIVPFRGDYYELVPARHALVRNLIYPVPDPALPFLGVHFTRMIHGGIEAGPNAVLALRREGYRPWSFSPRDALEIAAWGGTWRMARRFWRTGAGEFYRALSKGAFVRALRRLVPALRPEDVRRRGAGVRAQAVEPSGALVDDFRIVGDAHTIHVVNAPSPAATASIVIGREIARQVTEAFDLA
ncbi:MAG TPA: L-2-hydroxyglutarate oxidase [Candidatus Binatia bacterium]|nr:L-2-hydroxyglutarate oxidase [Candidatus Binatia bacterium]